MPEQLFEINGFPGIDNTSDMMSVSVKKPNGIYCYDLNNVDIDDNLKAHRRDGYGSIVTSGSSIRSLWSNDKICLFVDGTTFNKLNTNDTVTSLITGVDPTDTFAYVEVGNFVYFSNREIVGYIDTRVGTSSSFPDPAQTFKTRMVGGQILEYHYNRLYAAHDENLFFSDPTILTRMDTRKNAIAFPSRISMLKSVSDGLYVSDGDKVYFLNGKSPLDFVSKEVLDIPAIDGMSATAIVKKRKASVRTVIFLTSKGMYEGFPEGVVVPKQNGLFSISGINTGAVLIKNSTYQQYIGIGVVKSEFPSESPSQSASGSPSLSPSASRSPSRSPSPSPSLSPSASLSPSRSPSASPSQSPSESPSHSKSKSHSESPSRSPSYSPSASRSPSRSPSLSPSRSPSESASVSPSTSPSAESASVSPSASPSLSPSASISPSSSPSASPSISPSRSPSLSPSISLSVSPSLSPSGSPSVSPSISPSLSPSTSLSPSVSPSASSSESPSLSPSESPSKSPSESPSESESKSPSLSPSKSPSVSPSRSPSISPSKSPSRSPSASPSVSPSPGSPSASPSESPSEAIPDSTAYKGVVMNLTNQAISTYTNYPFNSLAYYNSKYLGAVSEGIYVLSGDTDNGSIINSTIKTGPMDFGEKQVKHIRDLWLTHRTDGRLAVTLSTDEDTTTEVERRTQVVSDELHEEKLKVPRGLRGRYYTLEMKNLSGADFDLDSVSVMVDILRGKKR